jgi:PAS domain S-box-containing protein
MMEDAALFSAPEGFGTRTPIHCLPLRSSIARKAKPGQDKVETGGNRGNAGLASERSFVCRGLGNRTRSTSMMPNFLPSSLRENPFRGELTDEQFQTIFAQNICYSVLDENAIIAITDVKGIIKYANHAFVQLSKYSPDELVGADHRILNSGFHPRSFFTDMYRDIAKGKKWRGEIRNRAKDGSFYWVDTTIVPILGERAKLIGYASIRIDVTGRKQMEFRLEQQARDLLRSNEELEQFAYVASHDLKAPLRGIENLVSWIEEDLESSLTGDTRTNMDLLKSRVRRLESLLDDLLAYSRAGCGDTASSLVDTKELVEELALLVSPPPGFSIAGGETLPTLRTARAPLTQVVQNLIGNAIKHHGHPATGHVWIEAITLPDVIEFTVTDDGPGIPERFRERVFGMFQTLKPRDEVEGSGMGLAIVKKLVERQGGEVWLTGGRAGQGLSVHFTWPHSKQENTYGIDGEFAAG